MDICDMYVKVAKAFNHTFSDDDIYTVFHYTSSEGLMGIFKDALPKLYFSQYDSLNDYKERLDITEYVSGYCDYKVKQKVMSEELCNAIKMIVPSDKFCVTTDSEETIQLESGEIIDNITCMSDKACYTYICSFSLEEDLLPM